MVLSTDEIAQELRFLQAKASRYAFWGTAIAGAAVVIATLLVSYFMIGTISIDGIARGQASNIALWVLDAMPFVFATWGQYASHKMADEATHMVSHKTQDLRHALDAAKLSNQAKSDFFSKMSHELRSPLNGVIGMVDMLLETPLDEEQRRYVNVIRSSSHGLVNLINDILDFSKIEAGKLALEHIEFDLRECIEGCIALLTPQARLKSLALTADIPQELPERLMGDPGRLRQVVINLITNAIKFTEQGRVLVSVRVLEDSNTATRIRVAVADTGIGMSEATRLCLFQPYQQGDAAIARKYGGTGLGLVISKELIETMGGEVGVSSAENEGSTFWFDVALPRPSIAAAMNPADVALAHLHVLVADENAGTRTALAKQLRALGVEVEEVADGVAALQMILVAASTGYRFDCVFADMFLPCMDAETLGRELKSRTETREIVLILMTAVGSRGDAQRANEIGFAAYVKKPVPGEDVAPLLHAAIGTRHWSEAQRRTRGVITRYTLGQNKRPDKHQDKRPLKVLLADDSAVNREILHKMLEKLGHRIDVARDGREAVAAVSSNGYDVVLMDLQMPVLDGFGAIEAIRRLAQTQPPIIAITAGLTDSERARCKAQGANEILLKPTAAADLTTALARAMQDARGTKQAPAHRAQASTAPVRTHVEAAPIPAAQGVGEVFIAEVTQRLAALRVAFKQNDKRRIAREAHTLKGASAHLSADAMREAATRLEQFANAGRMAEAETCVDALEQAFRVVQLRLLPPQEGESRATIH